MVVEEESISSDGGEEEKKKEYPTSLNHSVSADSNMNHRDLTEEDHVKGTSLNFQEEHHTTIGSIEAVREKSELSRANSGKFHRKYQQKSKRLSCPYSCKSTNYSGFLLSLVPASWQWHMAQMR
jgi:hypothetical protein